MERCAPLLLAREDYFPLSGGRLGWEVKDTILLNRIIQLTLVPDGENADQVLLGQEAIKRDIAGFSIGNDQLAHVPFDASAYQRVIRQGFNGFADGGRRRYRRVWVVLGKEVKCALKVDKRVLCIDYLRHGFGRAA